VGAESIVVPPLAFLTQPFLMPVEALVSIPVKKPRTYYAPIILDPDVEVEYKKIQQQAFDDQERRLTTFKHRVENARARFLDPVEAEAEVQKIIAEDTTANEVWSAKCVEAKKLLDEATHKFVFRSIGRKKFAELMDANPPREEDIAEWDNADDRTLPAAVNELGFAKDLIAAASVSPRLSRDDVEGMFDDPAWNTSELTLLYVVARNAQLNV